MSPLNEIETKIVARLAEGKTAKEIAKETGASSSFVDSQIRLARRVANVTNSAGLVANDVAPAI